MRNREVGMRRIVLVLLVAMALSGCVGDNGVKTTTSTITATTPAIVPSTTAPPATGNVPPQTPVATSGPEDMPGTGVVTAAWLKDHLEDVLVAYVGKTTKDKSAYEIAHIPGAVYLDGRELCRPATFSYLGVDREVNCCVFGDPNELCTQAPLSGGFNYQVSTKEQFEKLAGSLGVTKDRPVVVYGPHTDPYVARAFWDFAYYGQTVYFLDGGSRAWRYGTTMNQTEIIPTKYTATPDDSLRATADYVNSKLDDPNVVVVDVRALKEHTGEQILSNNLRGGHIPGGIRMDWRPSNLNRDGTFKSKEELRKIYEAAGITSDKEAITHCEGGVRSSHTFLVLKYILGYPKVRNFEASWNEWGNAKNLDGTYKYPIEK